MKFVPTIAALLVAGLAGPLNAAPVTLSYASTGSAVHTFFEGQPLESKVQLTARSGSLTLEPDAAPAWFELADVYVGTGAADPGSGTSEKAELDFQVTIQGVTKDATVVVQLTEILNDQYQFSVLDSPTLRFDLGGLGLLTLDFYTYSNQWPANDPFDPSPFSRHTYLPGLASITGTSVAVPTPGSLALAMPALALLAASRRRRVS